MIKDTLIALVRAGEDALAAAQSGPPADVRVVHAPGGAADGPLSVVIAVRNGPVDRAYLGVDAPLAAAVEDRFATLCETFARAFASRSPTPRTMAGWRCLPDAAERPVLMGPRRFNLHFRGRGGELYVTTEVFSRGAYETARAAAYEEEIVRHYLPLDLSACSALERELEVSAAVSLAGKLELDLAVEVGAEGGDRSGWRGVIVAKHRENDGGGIALSVDADDDGWRQLAPGSLVDVSFGLLGRVFSWRSRVVGHETMNLVRKAGLTAVTVAMPRTIEVSQRRREFRIAPSVSIDCQVRLRPNEAPQVDPFSFQNLEMPRDGVVVEVLDLSFSGAGLLGSEDLPKVFPAGTVLEFWLVLPGRRDPVRLGAVVRQAAVVLTGRNRRQGRLGVEFHPGDEAERRARQAIEHHVMSIERQMAFLRAVAADRQVV